MGCRITTFFPQVQNILLGTLSKTIFVHNFSFFNYYPVNMENIIIANFKRLKENPLIKHNARTGII
jgi:hypothetical protein